MFEKFGIKSGTSNSIYNKAEDKMGNKIMKEEYSSWVSLHHLEQRISTLVDAYLLKLATIIGIGKVMHKTPQIAQREATSLPAEVVGDMSP